MHIKIDEKVIVVSDPTKNIVEIGDENGITIIAPCFRNGKKNGCCKACVIEIDGKQQYACNIKPEDGMNITYNRDDLSNLRKERLASYAEGTKSGNTNTCSGTDPTKLKTVSYCGCSDSSCC